MAVELEELIPDLLTEVNPPGSDLFPNATAQDWLSMLRNAFWEATLDKVIVGYTEEDGVVTPKNGTQDLGRDFQQIIIYYAGVRVLKNRLSDLKTLFRTKAGSVEYETQQSAQVLRALLEEAVRRRDHWLEVIAENHGTPTYYIDAVRARERSAAHGVTSWLMS